MTPRPSNAARPDELGVTQLALFDLSAYAGKRGCLFPGWLAKQLRRKPKRGILPAFPAAQLRLEPCKPLMDIFARLRQLHLGDALVCGRERVEYVWLASGGYDQLRWYRGDRIVGCEALRGGSAHESIKSNLAPVLFARGWNAAACVMVECGAYGRRRTRRALVA